VALTPSKGSAGRASGGFSEQMATLASVIKDLEDQLDRMISANDALKKDLHEERQRRIELETSTDDLKKQLMRTEKETASREMHEAELAHLAQERTRLTGKVRELNDKFQSLERENRKYLNQLERLKAARSDAVQEVHSVESQFERAMQLVARLKTQLLVVGEERDALAGQSKVSEERLAQLRHERDAMLAEVEESRSALDEIRRSLVDAVAITSPAKE
jgi:chromosome segregation ATPase